MHDDAVQVSAPPILDRKGKIILTVLENELLGSNRHVIRFDMYPVHAPSHPERHHGFWDIPMKHIRRERTVLTFKREKLYLNGSILPLSFRAAWRGPLAFSGTCALTVSILDVGSKTVQILFTQTSVHLLPAISELPLVRASLYITRRCNLRCELCVREFFQSGDDTDTPRAVIDAVVEESPRLASVLLHGDGEPLINPELRTILTTLKRTMASNGKVGIFTNGMLLNRNMARELVDRGLDWLSVSIDGATESTVEHIRRGSHFKTIVKNLRYAVEYAERTRPGGIQFTIHFTTRARNVKELPDLVKLAAELGVDNVTTGILRNFNTGEFLAVPTPVLDAAYAEASRVGRELGVNLALLRPRPFGQPWCPFLEEVFVHVSGDVSSCAFRKPGNPERTVYILGNVKETPLSEIWNSPRCKDLRRNVIAGDFPEGCLGCEYKAWGRP